MSTSVRRDTEVTSAAVQLGRGGIPSRLRGGPRRSVPHLALGMLLVVACATGFAVVSTQLDDRVPVLALAEPVTVGEVLTPEHLREVSFAADSGVEAIPSSQARSVVGSSVAVSLPAGTLLSPTMLGTSAVPGSSEAIVAVALPPGAFPPETSSGAHVVVVPAPTDPAGTANSRQGDADDAASGWIAVVVGVHPTTTEGTTVVSLQVEKKDATAIAAAGAVSVVITSSGSE